MDVRRTGITSRRPLVALDSQACKRDATDTKPSKKRGAASEPWLFDDDAPPRRWRGGGVAPTRTASPRPHGSRRYADSVRSAQARQVGGRLREEEEEKEEEARVVRRPGRRHAALSGSAPSPPRAPRVIVVGLSLAAVAAARSLFAN